MIVSEKLNENLENVTLTLILFNFFIRIVDGYITVFGDVMQLVVIFLILVSFLRSRNNLSNSFVVFVLIFFGTKMFFFDTSISDEIKFITTILLFIFFSSNQQRIDRFHSLVNEKKDILRKILYLCTGFVVLQMFNSDAYNIVYGEMTFKANLHSPHSLAYLIMAMFLLNMLIHKSKTELYVLSLLYFWITSLSQVRTVAIVLAGLMAVIIINKKDYILLILGSLGAAMFLLWDASFLNNLSIFRKSQMSAQYLDVSAGRFRMWSFDIMYFLDSPYLNILFGNGSKFTKLLHLREFNQEIWSHNDFLQVLLAHGMVGILTYLYAMFKCISFNKVHLFFAGIIVFLAAINGFYPYSEFVYTLPVIAVYCKYNASISNTLFVPRIRWNSNMLMKPARRF